MSTRNRGSQLPTTAERFACAIQPRQLAGNASNRLRGRFPVPGDDSGGPSRRVCPNKTAPWVAWALFASLGFGCARPAPAPPKSRQPSASTTAIPSAPRSLALQAADTLRDQGKVLAAVEAYAQAAQAEPSDHRPWVEIGKLLMENNQPEDARDAFAEAVGREPGTSVHDAWHGAAIFRSGDPQTGLDRIREAVEAVPDNAEAHGLLADACHDAGLLAEERRAREAAVRLAPDHPEPWRALGRTCYSGKDFSRLAQVGVELARTAPDDPDGPVWQALGTAILGSDAEATIALDKTRTAVKRHPKHPFAHIALARLAKRAHAWKESRDALAKALSLDPRRMELNADLAVVERLLGNPAAAAAASARHRTALASRQTYEDAIRVARERPTDLNAQLSAIRAAEAQGERRTARECLARARRVAPGNTAVDAAARRLGAGS